MPRFNRISTWISIAGPLFAVDSESRICRVLLRFSQAASATSLYRCTNSRQHSRTQSPKVRLEPSSCWKITSHMIPASSYMKMISVAMNAHLSIGNCELICFDDSSADPINPPSMSKMPPSLNLSMLWRTLTSATMVRRSVSCTSRSSTPCAASSIKSKGRCMRVPSQYGASGKCSRPSVDETTWRRQLAAFWRMRMCFDEQRSSSTGT
mmetsp:Transcript_554/g.1441  ORF Transcript_554/g.1441 Transcript_554/m.1441 type:complete len:209 (+) Transcript_554:471-1097(+)